MRKALSIFLIMLSFVGLAQSGFEARLDTQQIKLGEPIQLDLYAQIPSNQNYTWPELNKISTITIISKGKIDSSFEGEQLKLHQQITFTSFDSGAVYLPSLQLSIENGEVLESDSIPILVYFPDIKEDQDYFDIKGPREIPFNYLIALYWTLGALASAGLLYFLWYKFLKNRKTERIKPSEPPIPPVEWASQALDDLEAKALWQDAKYKLYYSELIDILRRFLEKQYGIKTMELTADELSDKLVNYVREPELYKALKNGIQLSALVKFAKEKPLPEENIRALSAIREFVNLHQVIKTDSDV